MISVFGVPVSWIEALLVVFAFCNGVWNTVVGSTGGIMFATLAATLSPAVAVPIQSIVEGVSGIFRAWVLRNLIEWRFLKGFAVGALPGFLAGFMLVLYLTRLGNDAAVENGFRLMVGGFILLTTWVPLARHFAKRREAPLAVGTITTFMSVFVGGLGAPIAAAVESRAQPHATVLATATTALVYQYCLRLLVFGLVGFSFTTYWPLILGLTVASVAGTWVGTRVLVKVDSQRAKQLFRIVVTLIAISMIARALFS